MLNQNYVEQALEAFYECLQLVALLSKFGIVRMGYVQPACYAHLTCIYQMFKILILWAPTGDLNTFVDTYVIEKCMTEHSNSFLVNP